MSIDALRHRAASLGVELSYRDVHGVHHEPDPRALAAVVEVLEADRGRGDAVFEPVVVTRFDERHGHVLGRATVPVTDAELVLADGTTLRPTILADRHGLVVRERLPVGCHTLSIETGSIEPGSIEPGSIETGSRDAVTTSTIVHPPRTIASHGRWFGGSSLFVPAYALWDDDHPLPSLGVLGRLAEHLGAAHTEVLTTLPLFATFLHEPFEPSPYSPASRLHWNEVFLDDHLLPEAPLPELGRHLDWAALGRRRREQLRQAAAELDPTTAAALDRFIRRRPDVSDFARFLVERGPAPTVPTGVERRSHELAQMMFDRQLDEIAAAETHGAAGLAIDLPIGCHPDGFERWAHPELFADGFSIGAPPDMFFTEGQDWGLPPQLPDAGRRSGHRLWRDLLTRAGEHAALVRIDHVMAVHRLWWVPDGFSAAHGVYVRYPRDEILAVIAATAAECGTAVVGEDLGTVPEEVGEALASWDMLGMHEEQFHMVPDMLPDTGLSPIASRTVAGIRTHDMQPFAAFVEAQGAALDDYRDRLADELGHEVGTTYGDLLDAVLERLARSSSALVTVDLDDLVGELEHHNVPGQVLATNWCRRLDQSVSALMADPEMRRRLRLLGDRRDG